MAVFKSRALFVTQCRPEIFCSVWRGGIVCSVQQWLIDFSCVLCARFVAPDVEGFGPRYPLNGLQLVHPGFLARRTI